jgi:Icc protein
MRNYLVQLSDPHIRAPGLKAYGRVDTALHFAQAVDAVNGLRQPPDAVVITGDLTDFGRAEEYAHLERLLRPLRCPVYLLPGNHDDRQGIRSAFPHHRYLATDETSIRAKCDASDFIQYSVKIGGLRLVTVDTVVPRSSFGAVPAARIAHVRQMLTAAVTEPTIIAMHHPPFRTLIGHMDDIGMLEGERELAEVVNAFPNVERVICGHLHRSIQARWAGTVAICAPSTAHQVVLDLADDSPSVFTMEPPGFLIHAWGDDGVVVTHEAVVGEFAGPFPFHEDGKLID